MAKFKTLKRFRDREGKDFDKLTEKQKSALSIYEANKPYESDDTKWTDHLIKEGYLKSTNEKTTLKEVEKKEDKPKSTTRKKASE